MHSAFHCCHLFDLPPWGSYRHCYLGCCSLDFLGIPSSYLLLLTCGSCSFFQVLGPLRVLECSAIPSTATRTLSWCATFVIFGLLLWGPLPKLQSSFSTLLVWVVLHHLLLLTAPLWWFQTRLRDLLTYLLQLPDLRPELRLRPLSSRALEPFCPCQGSSVDLPLQEERDWSVPGKLVSGQRQSRCSGFVLRTVLLLWICAQGFTLWSRQKELRGLPFSGQPILTGEPSALWKEARQSAIPSLQRLRQRSTWLVPARKTLFLRPKRSNGFYGDFGWRGGLGECGAGFRNFGAIHPLSRGRSRGGWRDRSHCFGGYEATSGSACRYACRHPLRRDFGQWKYRRWKSSLWVVEVPSVIIDNGQISPTGGTISVVIVDCLVDILARMRLFTAGELIVYGFDEDSPFALPSPDALLTEAVKWLSTATMERVAYYTPDEEEVQEPQEPQVVPPLPVKRGKAPTVVSGTAKEKAKPKRATTTSLAADIEVLKQSIPELVAQVGALQSRIDKDSHGPQLGGLARPLSSSLNVPKGSMTLGAAAKAIAAPPKTQTRGAPGMLGSPLLTPGKPVEVQELEEEKQAALTSSIQISDNALALAVLEQSKALTSLVSQISSASSDPMADLLQGSSGGTRGSVGRVRLQAELAAQKGIFFQSGLQQISRRMAPTSSADMTPPSYARQGHQWCQIPGAVWWLWQAEGVGTTAVPDHGHLGQSHGGEHRGCEGWCGPARSDGGSSLHGLWPHGFGHSFVSSGGPTFIHLCEPTPQQHFEGEGFLGACRPEMGHLCIGLSEGKRGEMLGSRVPNPSGVEEVPTPKPKPKGAPKKKWKPRQGGTVEEEEQWEEERSFLLEAVGKLLWGRSQTHLKLILIFVPGPFASPGGSFGQGLNSVGNWNKVSLWGGASPSLHLPRLFHFLFLTQGVLQVVVLDFLGDSFWNWQRGGCCTWLSMCWTTSSLVASLSMRRFRGAPTIGSLLVLAGSWRCLTCVEMKGHPFLWCLDVPVLN